MPKSTDKAALLERRKKSIRKTLVGTPDRPRLTVRRSLKHIYAQVIDDSTGRTLAEASSISLKIGGKGADAAKEVGKAVAERAKEKSVSKVCFDRNGRRYHGRIKALAEAAREAGLEF